jgi:hypothetical protein
VAITFFVPNAPLKAVNEALTVDANLGWSLFATTTIRPNKSFK